MLFKARFARDQIASGTAVDVTVEWKSAAATTLFLNFDTTAFTVTPTQFPLAATGGTRASTTVAVTITKRKSSARFCDVHFVQGASDELDSVEVT